MTRTAALRTDEFGKDEILMKNRKENIMFSNNHTQNRTRKGWMLLVSIVVISLL